MQLIESLPISANRLTQLSFRKGFESSSCRRLTGRVDRYLLRCILKARVGNCREKISLITIAMNLFYIVADNVFSSSDNNVQVNIYCYK